jgi:hypothetical protein
MSQGIKMGVADFLSRLYFVPETKEKDPLGPKDGQHIVSPFSPYKVLTKEDVLAGFTADVVSPCSDPSFCHLNVNNFLYKN